MRESSSNKQPAGAQGLRRCGQELDEAERRDMELFGEEYDVGGDGWRDLTTTRWLATFADLDQRRAGKSLLRGASAPRHPRVLRGLST